MKLNNFKEYIDFYYKRKKNNKNEYELKNGLSLRQNTSYIEGLCKIVKTFNNGSEQIMVEKEGIERFHPNNINNKEFWKYSKIKFPLFSVCGHKTNTISDCNSKTLEVSKLLGLFPFITEKINQSKQKLNIFEIGYGHGNVFEKINKISNYKGIDFYKIKKLNKYNNLIIINKSGIPNKLIKDNSMDIIYSVNVLQHCSQKDRFDYIKQGYKKLKKGGYFVGTCFLETKSNSKENCWGYIDEKGRKYCNFFNQLTEVDTELELKNLFYILDFEIIKFNVECINLLSFILKKKYD